jgi:streptomycin 6-kinase
VPGQLFTLERWFRGLFMKAEKPGSSPEFAEAVAIARELLASPTNIKVLHADIHHENILFSRERGWLAIDPKGILGEATFDVANVFYNPGVSRELLLERRRIEDTARIFSERLCLDYERILLFAYAYGFLSASWMSEENQNPAATLTIASRIRAFL